MMGLNLGLFIYLLLLEYSINILNLQNIINHAIIFVGEG